MRYFSLMLTCTALWSLPREPLVTAGTVQMIQEECGLRVIASDCSVIGWEDFSIGPDEWTQFDLPSKNALVLNRVISDIPSLLLGNLSSNGQILLINRNGVLIGKDARVDMAGFIASTLDSCDDAFVARGELSFLGGHSKAAVQNLGSIKAFDGDVFLIGWNVDNQGIIDAPNGLAGAIASGHVVIRPEGSERIYIKAHAMGENSYSTAFFHEGSEDALEIEEIHGQIRLKGSISAKDVRILGDFIDATELVINAPGGTVYIGGGEKGQNQNFLNAKHVFLDESVAIHADAFDGGSGGKVIVWSDGHAHFLGQITARGFDGGFAEVSGKNHLDYRGLADLRGIGGDAGTLLLDPIDIVVGVAGAGALAGGACSYCSGAAVACSIYSTGSPTVLSNAVLAPQLLLSNVLLDATVAGGGGGTITIGAGANVFWNSPFSLGLNAINAITIRACLQNGGTGDVTLESTNGPITLDASFVAASGQGVYVGSLDGTTRVCSPGADLTLQGNNTLGITGAGAQIGFNRSVPAGMSSPPLAPPALPAVITANGPIDIRCRNLTLLCGNRNICGTQIGHGQMDTFGGVTPTLTTGVGATISVQANGNINLLCTPNKTSVNTALIGHGCDSLTVGSVLLGDISVVCTGNIRQEVNIAAVFIGISSRIGHGINTGTVGAIITAGGNINVQAGGNITLQDNLNPGGNFTCVAIGHFASRFGGPLTGDVTVTSGGTISILGATPSAIGGTRMGIGHINLGSGTGGPFQSNTRVSACQDLIMNVNNEAVYALGFQFSSSMADFGNVEVSVGRDLIMTATGTRPGFLGNNFSNAGSVSSTFVAVGRDISISGIQNIGIRAFGNVNVSAGRNITVTANGAGISYIGTERGTTPSFTTRVYAGGNVIATNSAISRAFIGRAVTTFVVPYISSLDIRAGGDINLSATFTNGFATSGSIFLEADTILPNGALWSSGGGFVNSIATISMTNPTGGAALPIPLPPSCPASAIASNSPAITPDGRGGLGFNTGAFGGSVILSTTGGNITLHSASLQTGGASQNLTIGTGANNANILTTSGNIEIWGCNTSPCVRGDSYHNITIDQAIVTTGSVFISANNNIDMTAVSSIATPSSVTLIVDNQMPVAPLIGGGSFLMSAGSFITSGAGLLQIYTALQNQNTINGTLNGVNPFVPGTLFVDSTQEIWCTYFCTPISVGSLFRISYKNCLQAVLQQAMIVVDQFFVDLHPYNEFPGWKVEFYFKYRPEQEYPDYSDLPFFLRRRHLNHLNQPKTYTVY